MCHRLIAICFLPLQMTAAIWAQPSASEVLEQLKDPDPKPRLLAAMQVERLCLQGASIDDLITVMSRDSIPLIRGRAASIVGSCGLTSQTCLEVLNAAIGDSDPNVVRPAAGSFVRLERHDLLVEAIVRQGDRASEVASWVEEAFAQVKATAEVSAVLKTNLSDPNPSTRAASLQLMESLDARCADDVFSSVLQLALSDPD